MNRQFVSAVFLSAVLATAANAERPNFLILVSDDQRPDTIAALGNPHIKTPTLDSLVKSGTAFTRAVCANPICTPSRAEILSGFSSFQNGVGDFGGKLKPELVLWPQAMRAAGYRTWYVGKWHNDGRPIQRGYDATLGLFRGGGGRWAVPTFDWNGVPVTGYRGWIFQDDEGNMFPQRGIGLTSNISADFADAAIELIKRKSEKPFFIHVNFTAPHDPLLMPHGYEGMYDPDKIPLPENFKERHPFDHGNYEGRDERLFNWPRTPEETRNELAVYYAVISHMDAQIGRIIETLKQTGQYENTVVVFASDHGLGVGRHGLRGKQSMYEHTIGVPYILSGPGVPKGKQSAAQCYLRDLYPTTCDLAGIAIPKTVQAKSLKPVLDGKTDKVRDAVYGYFRKFQRMIRTDEWKLIEYPEIQRTQLFHLKSDPHELKNLASDPNYQKITTELRQRLKSWQREQGDPLVN